MGAWGHGFPYGIFSHLDWVSNVGYQYLQLPLQPGAYDRGHLLLHHDLALALHGGWSCRRPTRRRARTCAPRNMKTPSSAISSATRSARSASTVSACSGAECRLLERGLHRHQRHRLEPSLADWWNWWSTCRSGSHRGGVMAEYQNIFTQVQVQGPPEMGMVETWIRPNAQGTRFSNYWIGKFGNAQLGPFYLGGWGSCPLASGIIWFVIIGPTCWPQVGWNPVNSSASCSGFSLEPPPPNTACRSSAAERRRLVASGRLLPADLRLTVVGPVLRWPQQLGWASMSSGPSPPRSGCSWCWAFSARS
jgi:hypothetical protein